MFTESVCVRGPLLMQSHVCKDIYMFMYSSFLTGDVFLLHLPVCRAVLLPCTRTSTRRGHRGNHLHVLPQGTSKYSFCTGCRMQNVSLTNLLLSPYLQFEIWADIRVWRQAATQVFFALGLGFGSIIAYSSYNPKNNNCHRDAFTVSFINFLTSVLATLVVFAVLGFRAKGTVLKCVARYVTVMINLCVRQCLITVF